MRSLNSARMFSVLTQKGSTLCLRERIPSSLFFCFLLLLSFCVRACGEGSMGVFLSHSPRYSLKRQLSLNLELGWSHLSWLGTYVHLPSAGVQIAATLPGFSHSLCGSSRNPCLHGECLTYFFPYSQVPCFDIEMGYHCNPGWL